MCGACQNGFLLNEDNKCIDTSSNGYFAGSVNWRYGITGCFDGCDICESQTVCITCKNGQISLKDRAGNTRCLEQEAIKDPSGPDPRDLNDEKRRKICPKGCKQCSLNADICEECYDTDALVIRERLPDGSHEESCTPKLDIPEEFGINIEESSKTNHHQVWARCRVNGCADCKKDHQDCLLCTQQDSDGLASRHVYLKIENKEDQKNQKKSCVGEIEEGYGESGVITSTKQKIIRACAVEGCSDCRRSHLVCSKCKEPLVIVEESVDGKSIYKCIKTHNKEKMACNIRGCLSCKI